MNIKTILVASVAALALLSCSSKKEAVLPSIHDVDFAHQASDLPVDEAVVYGVLPNGVRYAVLHNETPTKTASLRVRISTGSLNETDEQQGLAHFIEHMAFNGSTNIPEGEMTKRLERFGLAFGADTNAHTSFDETVYKLDLPEVSEAIIDETFMIMRETVENLSFNPEAIERERGVVKSEKRNGDSASARAGRADLEFTTRGSRLSERLPIGIDATLDSVMAADFRAYYNAYYRPENTFVVFVGDVETSYAVSKITEYFSDWVAVGEPGAHKTAGITNERPADAGYFGDPEVQTAVSWFFLEPYEDEMDTAETRKQSFIDGLGMRIVNRRMSSLARDADAEFLSGSMFHAYAKETADIIAVAMNSRPENWEASLALGEQELRKALLYGFTQAELDEQIANSRKSMQVSVQTAPTRRTRSLASGLVSSFAGESVYTTPQSGLERFESYAGDITTDMVWHAFKRQWGDMDAAHIWLQTSDVLENPEAEIRAAYDASLAVEVVQNEVVDLGTFAYTDFGAPGKVISTNYIEDIDAYTYKFENNVLLNFKHTEFAKDSVTISISVGDGSLSAPSKNRALNILASSVMGAGGYEVHSADDIQRLMAGKAVGAGFGIGTRSFTISGATVPSDLTDQFNLMMAQLTAPGYRPESKAQYDKFIESVYPTLDSTPDGVASRDIERLLHSGDGRYGIPTEEILLSQTIDGVRSWIAPELKNGQIEISVVGDIDRETIVGHVERTFGTLPKRKLGHGSYPQMTKIVFPKAPAKPVTLRHSGDDNRALLRVYWPAPDGTEIMRNRRLSVLSKIFGNRLTDVIREEESAAYSPGAWRSGSRIFPDYGYMAASLGLTPEMVPYMITKLDMIAADFGSGGITEDEFTRAMKPILEGLDSSLESNGYWLGVISHVQTDPWGLDNFRSRDKAFQNMTLDDIKPLAADIFGAGNAYRVQILPESE